MAISPAQSPLFSARSADTSDCEKKNDIGHIGSALPYMRQPRAPSEMGLHKYYISRLSMTFLSECNYEKSKAVTTLCASAVIYLDDHCGIGVCIALHHRFAEQCVRRSRSNYNA